MKNKVRVLLESILLKEINLKQTHELHKKYDNNYDGRFDIDKPKIKLVPLWQDRKEKRYEKVLSQQVIEGTLNLEDASIENIGNIRHVKGHLFLFNCKNLKELPAGLTVEKNLILTNCLSLTGLPADLKVGSSLHCENCKNLISLPNNLTIKGVLDLDYCENLTSLPADLIVKDKLYLRNTGIPFEELERIKKKRLELGLNTFLNFIE